MSTHCCDAAASAPAAMALVAHCAVQRARESPGDLPDRYSRPKEWNFSVSFYYRLIAQTTNQPIRGVKLIENIGWS